MAGLALKSTMRSDLNHDQRLLLLKSTGALEIAPPALVLLFGMRIHGAPEETGEAVAGSLTGVHGPVGRPRTRTPLPAALRPGFADGLWQFAEARLVGDQQPSGEDGDS